MEHKNEAFEYTYSAPQQEEIRLIREKYLPKEDKLTQLRRLDKSASAKGTRASIITGTLGALVMGTGMSCCMVWTDILLIPGIVIGLLGMAAVAAAYPLYVSITKKERERIAPEILRLTDELMK